MLWMRDNTPEPFKGESIYNEFTPVSKKNEPPTPDYTVSAWWDYGYWITRIGHRVPNANPAQNVDAVRRMANLLLSTGDDYREQVSALKSGYVVLDNATTSGKFYAVASWDGKDSSDYFGVYRVPDKEGDKTVVLFYPEYYKTLVSRLYNFNGEAVVPERTIVITYKDDIVLEAKEFADYYRAQEYVDQTPNTRIVSADPTASPIPLGKINYKLAHQTGDVKVFEYAGEK
jgi:dolichyl-diphosphooligosaccharide--protein glycosyltransferase